MDNNLPINDVPKEPGLATPYEAEAALVHEPTPVTWKTRLAGLLPAASAFHVGVAQIGTVLAWVALIGSVAMIAIGVVSFRVPFVGKIPAADPPHEVVQEADLKALIAAYTGLSNALPQAKTTAERARIKQEATVIIARIRTLVDVMPDDKVPAEAKRFKLAR